MTEMSGREGCPVNPTSDAELPRESADECDEDARRATHEHDQWLRDNVPPHHH